MDELLMGDEAARYVDLSRQRLHQLAAEGKLGRKLSKHWVFTKAELEAYKASEKDKGGRRKSSALVTLTVSH